MTQDEHHGPQEISVQVSPKSSFTHQFSMDFAAQSAYDEYNSHPDHSAFVGGRRAREVAEFQEYDVVAE